MVKEPILIDLVQGSDSWKEFRREKIGASDAPIIMGVGYKSVTDLYEEKVNGKDPFVSGAMRRGSEMEILARKWAENLLGEELKPVVYQHAFHDWMIASFDGVNEDRSCAIEIKCPGERMHKLVKETNEIPDMYKWQMYHQMEVLNLKEMFYISFYDEEDAVVIKLDRDDVMIEHMVNCEKRFYIDHMMQKVKPSEPEEVEDLEDLEIDDERRKQFEIDFKNLKQIRDKIKHWQDIEKYLVERIRSRCEGKSVCLGSFKCTKFSSKGTVQYKDIPELKDVDLELYRGPEKEIWRITT